MMIISKVGYSVDMGSLSLHSGVVLGALATIIFLNPRFFFLKFRILRTGRKDKLLI